MSNMADMIAKGMDVVDSGIDDDDDDVSINDVAG